MKAKLFYSIMALVMVMSLVVVPTVVAQEGEDPPYNYDPTSEALSLYAGGEASSFSLDISISWGGVTRRAVNTSVSVKSIDPAFEFLFNPQTFELGEYETKPVTVTVSAKEGAAAGDYTFKIIADDVDDGKPVIGEAGGCEVSVTVLVASTEVDLGIAVVVFEDVEQGGETTAAETQTAPCGPIPSGYTAVGSFVDITTTVIYGGVVAGVRYDDSQVQNEANLRLFHCAGTQWEDVTTYVDNVNNIVYGQPTTLSPLAVGEGAVQAAAEGCFIATAAYGTSTAEQLDILRDFRDEVLLQNSLGSQLVAFYYDISPALADFISDRELLRTLARELLVDPAVWVVEATEAIWGN